MADDGVGGPGASSGYDCGGETAKRECGLELFWRIFIEEQICNVSVS